ncbi:MAG: hypothetical protein DMF03_06465, partial [Verrucomicrobia bacterium]
IQLQEKYIPPSGSIQGSLATSKVFNQVKAFANGSRSPDSALSNHKRGLIDGQGDNNVCAFAAHARDL